MAAASQRPDAPRMACVRCLDLAERWLTSCSAIACVPMVDAFANFSDEALADMCISRWGLEQSQGEENDLTWFESHEASRDVLVWAFAAYRAFATQDQSER
jgi:hypothetical protein